MDYDPQGSSLHWLRSRAPRQRKFTAPRRGRRSPDRLRSLEMYVRRRPGSWDRYAAGASGPLLAGDARPSHCVIIPVVPSSLDIHATGDFIKDLLLKGRIREGMRLAVVANRVRRSMPVYPPLERCSHALNMKLLARLIDSDVYSMPRNGVGFRDGLPGVARRAQAVMPISLVEAASAARRAHGGTLYELGRTRSA